MHRYAVLLWLCVLASAVYQLDLKIAWNGFSPLDWVHQRAEAPPVTGAFPNGVNGYRYSAPMYLYPWFETGLGIPADYFVYLFVAFEIAVLMVAMCFLQRTLRPQAGARVVLLILVFSTTSWFRDVSLARYGQPIFLGLYYAIADAFFIAAAAMILRGRYLLAALMLSGAFVTHPALGLSGFAVCGAIVFYDRKKIRLKPVLIALTLFGVFVALWMSLLRNASLGGGGIPHDMWLGLTQALSWHWYPMQYGHFGANYNERFLGFISLLLLALYYIPTNDTGRRVLIGIVAALFISVMGVLVAWLFPMPFLVKMSLHRASDLVTLLALPYIASGLASDLRSDSRWIRVLAAGMLFAPFIHHRGMPLLLALPLLYRRCMRNAKRDAWYPRLRAAAWWVSVTLLVGYSVVYFDQPWDWKDFVRWGGLVALTATAFAYGYRYQWNDIAYAKSTGAMICALCIVWLAYTGLRLENTQEAQAYKDTQRWARANTPGSSLFMSDPTIVGWRDYSRRASFGNVYEWLYAGWLYDSQNRTFEEGLARYGELSPDLRRGLGFPRPLDGYSVLLQQAFNGYYAASDARLRELAHKYGITHFVFRKEYLARNVRLPVVYENAHFIIVVPN